MFLQKIALWSLYGVVAICTKRNSQNGFRPRNYYDNDYDKVYQSSDNFDYPTKTYQNYDDDSKPNHDNDYDKVYQYSDNFDYPTKTYQDYDDDSKPNHHHHSDSDVHAEYAEYSGRGRIPSRRDGNRGRSSDLNRRRGARNLQENGSTVLIEPVNNVTVAIGRSASLSCSVHNLGQHKVAWVHLNRKMIVAIHRQVVSRIERFTVTHDSHVTWTLNIEDVTKQDGGYYMCQVNTKPMISETGFLRVVVPPSIKDSSTSESTIIIREGENVTLFCDADGEPAPQIRWRREDGRPIETEIGKKEHQVRGSKLEIKEVFRGSGGAFLCIASNGIPPSVSKRINVDVHFAPELEAARQLVGVLQGHDVIIECSVQANPKPVFFWIFNENVVKNSSRVKINENGFGYSYTMFLHINEIEAKEFGLYLCVARNIFSESNAVVRINKIDGFLAPNAKENDKNLNSNRNFSKNSQSNASENFLNRPGKFNQSASDVFIMGGANEIYLWGTSDKDFDDLTRKEKGNGQQESSSPKILQSYWLFLSVLVISFLSVYVLCM